MDGLRHAPDSGVSDFGDQRTRRAVQLEQVASGKTPIVEPAYTPLTVQEQDAFGKPLQKWMYHVTLSPVSTPQLLCQTGDETEHLELPIIGNDIPSRDFEAG